MLDVSSGIDTALRSMSLRFAWLVKLGDDLHYTNHEVDIDYGGDTYTSEGDLLDLPSITRERQVKLQSVTLRFSNADGVMSYSLRHKYNPATQTQEPHDRMGDDCQIYLALLDDGGNLIDGNAISLYKGAIDTWTERDTDAASTIALKITSPWAKPNLTAGRITSDYSQKDSFPGDQFFEFAHEEKNTIGWGGEA